MKDSAVKARMQGEAPFVTLSPESPLTGTADVEKVRVVDPKVLAVRWKEELGVDVGPSFAALPSIELWRCSRTGLEWYTPPSAAGGPELYEQLSRHKWYYMEDKWEFRVALDCMSSGSEIFEIGSGKGSFLVAAAEQDMRASGLEWNASAAEEARRRGFRVFESDLASLNRDLAGCFDAVCAFQVLEHVTEPRAFLVDALGLLKPGGRLILSVPNASVMRFIDPQSTGLLDQPPHHMSHWDAGVFSRLEQTLPMRVKKIFREPLQLYHVDWFVGSLRGSYRRHFGGLWARLLFNKLVWAPIGWLLKAGLRRVVPGHTLLVVLERVR